MVRILTAVLVLSLISLAGFSGVFANANTCRASTPAPDLIVKEITWSPEDPIRGETVTFSVVIENDGSGSAGPSAVEFYIDDISRGFQDVPRIEAGDNVTKTFTWAAKSGTHFVKVVVDKNNQILEIDETNNEKTVTFFKMPPDLVVQAITWSPAVPVQGGSLTFSVTVRNQGDGKAEYIPVALFIDDVYLASASVVPIDPGATGVATIVWTVEAGSHTVRAVADYGNTIPEIDETNNEKTVTIPDIVPDLYVQDISWSPSNPAIGETVTFTVAIKNQGTARAVDFGVSLSVDGSSAAYKRVHTIAAGDTANITFTWNAGAGIHTVKVVVDKENEIAEDSEKNNEKSVSLSGAPLADLYVQDISWAPAGASVGDTVTFTVTVKNRGNGRAYDTSVACSIGDIYLESVPVGPMAPAATVTKTFTWTAEAGSHTISAVADYFNEIPESNEDNNEKMVTYPFPPDLAIETITWSPEEPSVGDNVTITVAINNRGSGRANYFRVVYYIDDVHTGFEDVAPLAPGATENRSFVWVAEAGSHVIRVIADSYERVVESDEDNNEMSTELSVSFLSSSELNPASTTEDGGTVINLVPLPSPKGGSPVVWVFVLPVILLSGLFIIALRRRQQQ